MKKSDLKDGMIIELSNGIFGILINGFIRHRMGAICLKEFNEDMTYNLYKSKNVDIIAIYSPIDIDNDGTNIEDIMRGNSLRKIWERKKEIDWSKVPKWTKVRCKGEFGYYNAYHYEYIPNEIHCFGHTTRDEFTFVTDPVVDYLSKRDTYEIHPSIEIPEEWYKE